MAMTVIKPPMASMLEQAKQTPVVEEKKIGVVICLNY